MAVSSDVGLVFGSGGGGELLQFKSAIADRYISSLEAFHSAFFHRLALDKRMFYFQKFNIMALLNCAYEGEGSDDKGPSDLERQGPFIPLDIPSR